MNEIKQGDSATILKTLPDESVNCCITSPPYWGLRDYGVEGQLGLERTPEEYVARMVEVFREVRRVLRDDGTLWLNLGDSYNAYNGGAGPSSSLSQRQSSERPRLETGYGLRCSLKPKDLVGIPWRVAFALQADGWFLRQDIIWHKPNPMPESVTDRCTKAHEYVFLLAKQPRYYYDADAVREEGTGRNWLAAGGNLVGAGKHKANDGYRDNGDGRANEGERYGRNRRDVWMIPTQPYKGAHFATFPEKLVEPCVLAGCPEGGVVLDPFGGSGTVGVVAKRLKRNFILIELNPEYVELARARIAAEPPTLF